jgi:hypothetical protein
VPAQGQIKRLQRNTQQDHEFSIFWVPRRTLVSDKILETEAVLGDVNIAELPLYFLPLDTDVLSLELEESFGDLHLVSLFSTLRLCVYKPRIYSNLSNSTKIRPVCI